MNAAGLILHVDDEPLVRVSMALLLHADGYGVDSAAGGAEAFQLVNSGFRPDVLIVDFNLGQQMTGVEVAAQVATILRYAPPIIIPARCARRGSPALPT